MISRQLLRWLTARRRVAVQYESAGQHDVFVRAGEMLVKKGLWAITDITDKSGCPADMTSITWSAFPVTPPLR